MTDFNHGLPDNPYNKHAWIFGKPEIGENVWIGAFCLIDAGHAPLKIGRGTNVSSGAQILTHTTVRRCISERRYGKIDARPTEVGEFCFIGTNAIVLMGARVGHHSVVAAGAVVPEGMVVPPYSIVAGVPGKIVGSSKKFLKGVEKESISVVMPAYNEEESIEKAVESAVRELEKITEDYEVVLVDDGSRDKTGEIADRLSSRKKIRVVHHKKNKGFTGAIKTCYKSAKKHLVFLAPADGQFDFRQLGKFASAIKGYDVAVGYRAYNPEAAIRKFNSKLFHLLCRFLLDIKLKEISTVIMWRKDVLNALTVESDERSAMIEPELIHKALKKGYKFTQVPIKFLPRQAGKSKGTNPKMIFKTLEEMIKLWWKTKISV